MKRLVERVYSWYSGLIRIQMAKATKQATLNFSVSRPPLAPITPNKRRLPSPETSSEPPVKRLKVAVLVAAAVTKPSYSRTAQQLLAVSVEQAQKTLQRLIDGYTQKSGQGYPGMKTNLAGCWLAQKSPNRDENGYIQLAPVVECSVRSPNGTHRNPVLPQGAHRLAVRAWKTEDEFQRLVRGEEASHLCHQKSCFNPSHIVVESKCSNELRKRCAAYRAVVTLVNWMGINFKVLPTMKCGCTGAKCIHMVQEGTLEKA